MESRGSRPRGHVWPAAARSPVRPALGQGAASAGRCAPPRERGHGREGTRGAQHGPRVTGTALPDPYDGAEGHFSVSHFVDGNETQQAARLVHAQRPRAMSVPVTLRPLTPPPRSPFPPASAHCGDRDEGQSRVHTDVSHDVSLGVRFPQGRDSRNENPECHRTEGTPCPRDVLIE